MARRKRVHVSAYTRRYPQLGDSGPHAITSTPATNPPGPRLWSGNAAEPQPVMVRNVPKRASDEWLWWAAILYALTRRR